MAATIEIKGSLAGKISRIPDFFPFFNIEKASGNVAWDIIVSVTGEPSELGILIKGITAESVRNQRVKIVDAKVINPGKRGMRSLDDILSFFIIEVSEFHLFSSHFRKRLQHLIENVCVCQNYTILFFSLFQLKFVFSQIISYFIGFFYLFFVGQAKKFQNLVDNIFLDC